MMTLIAAIQILALMAAKSALAAPLLSSFDGSKSDLVKVNRPRKIGSFQGPRTDIGLLKDIPAGETLDLFYRYGFYSLSVRVVPREDPGTWLIREPTAKVFEPKSYRPRLIPEENQFDSQFQLFFCDDSSELLEAYFRDFSVEGTEHSYKVFTGSWHPNTKARYFGLSKDMFDGHSKFVLVKLAKKRATIVVDDKPQLKPDAQHTINQIQIGDPDSILEFTRNHGSHYIRDVTVGDVIYQVFAMDDDQYARAKANSQFNDFNTFYDNHLAPWHVRETGKVLLASGDKEASNWVSQNLQRQEQFDSYPNIFKLMNLSSNEEMVLEDITKDTSAIIGIQLTSLRSWIPDINLREYYDEIVGSQSKLWAANI